MTKTISLKITGMTCSSCVLHIENDLKDLNGITEAVVNLPLKKGKVTFDSKKLSEKEIVKAVKTAGYTAVVDDVVETRLIASPQNTDDKQTKNRLIKLLVSFVLSVIILSLGFVWKIDIGMEVMFALSIIIILYSGRDFFIKGVPDLIKGRPAMDTLVALGVGAAFLYSTYLMFFTNIHEEYFMDVAVIVTFILFGRYLEARAKGKASSAIKRLLELSAKVAHRLTSDGSTEDIPADQVQLKDKLRVKPGEKIPTDGVIIEGYGVIDESMVTGESIPVDKKEGEKIIGANINGNTAFTMQATKIGSDTMLSQIVKMVQEAQMHKAPIQKLVDVVAGYFVWGVIAIATITFFGWTIIGNGAIANAFIPTVTVLIIACPCALGLATPISIVVGSGKGAQMGILIKKPESLEKAHKITAIAFDKTGTITKGHPEVQEFKSLNGDEKDNLRLALALETNSEHPLAKSVIAYAKRSKIEVRSSNLKQFKSLTGLGVTAKVDNKEYFMGSSKYMEDLKNLDKKSENEIDDMQDKGYTVLCLANEKEVLAIFGVQDGVKKTSKEAVKLLKKKGVHTVMITGDNEKVAQHIAKEVGIDEIHASVTPDKKSEIITDLQKEGYFVTMVGDGINDSPALAKADVGIAMGTGTDVAIETGDLVLVKGDLKKAVEAIELSKATLRNIKQNLFWAFIYNSIGIPLAALGFLNPTVSATAMAFSSVSVVLNALRLKRFKVK